MSRFSRTFLAASISTALFAPQIQADATVDNSAQNPLTLDQCLINPSQLDDPNSQPINVEADKLEAIRGQSATYSGNVVVQQGQRQIRANQVTLQQPDNIVLAEGDVIFRDGQVKAQSERVTNQLNLDQITLENTQYQFLCQPIRGHAAYVAKTGKAIYQVEDGFITSCPAGDNAWRLRASSIDVDQDAEQATFYNPRLEIQNIPVFYLPYLTVPIGDTRKTGFLYPDVSYGSRDGYELSVPFYWNLAPNYDLETTLRHMENRGTQMNTIFRYLTEFGQGSIKGEFLPEDELHLDQGRRWGYQYRHEGIFQQAWKFEVDYSRVSDIEYFSDLSSGIGNREEGQLMQQARVTYRSPSWDTSILVRDFQVLTGGDNLPYRLMPQVGFNYYSPELLRYLDLDIKSHVARFETDSALKPSATRVHIEPGISIPLGNTWGTWTTEARVLATYYQQDLSNITGSEYAYLEESVSRVIPEFRTHAGIVLERDTTLFNGYTQTLEPQLQYLYVPKENQQNIGLYDSTLLQTDYYGLFRSRKYSSIDRISAANQISYGASTRFFDDQFKERLNIAFGQIFYLDKSLKSTTGGVQEQDIESNYSAWAVAMDFNYDDFIFYHAGIQYDIDSSAMQLANSTLEYRFQGGYLQTNYRYVTKEYIEDTVGDSIPVNSITKQGISQLGLLGRYQVSPKWQISGQYFHDTTTNKALEWLVGLRYQSDCWYMGFTYSNQLKEWQQTPSSHSTGFADPSYENNFGFNIGIIGFGTNIGDSKSLSGIHGANNSLGYGRPFFLNN